MSEEKFVFNNNSNYYFIIREEEVFNSSLIGKEIDLNTFNDVLNSPTTFDPEIYNFSIFSLNDLECISSIELENNSFLEIDSSEKEEIEEELYENGSLYWSEYFINLGKLENKSIGLVESENDTKFILKWFISASQLSEDQINKVKFNPKNIQKVKNLVCIEEWENISLINSPIEYDNDIFDPLKVKINIIDKFDSHIESFIDDKELDNVIVGFSYEGNDLYLDQGDGDGANYSLTCKKFDI
ncbi:hypothetical protein CUB78_06200 [Prochlorococcus marinus str. XMU1401]|uniref:Uncharacterized protein n=1 Tax=Prochlorococcus marinus str. XMU1401 TaxID=2052594 RepID=A0A8I1X2V1_PROMR|nr:hypothetical protein [Prochlorococcus marinus]MBO8223194.1 hypothetical protein [Prochlorococcus marinus str. XMU1401]MBW3059727.1 hypothetical protein [Prochlorococcus marinus str. XMU1401E]PJC83544.1 hypothetical protein CUB78_06200 [Prochlorococcus marinus str. XMU1401]